jgi:hypothetical protein
MENTMSNASTAEQHGPTPFKFGNTMSEQRMVLDAKGKYVCNVQIHQTPRSFGLFDEPQREANAAFIVRACNSHEQLVAALRGAHGAIDTLMACLISLDPTFMPSKSAVWPALTACTAALATAEA